MLTRRQLLAAAGTTAAGAASAAALWKLGLPADAGRVSTVGTVPPSSAAAPSTAAAPTTAPSGAAGDGKPHALVVLQLSGGNDGLNTLVPLDGRYHDARPTLGLADASLVPMPGTSRYGLHPALAPLRPLLAAGQVAFLEAIGFPDPDRSHFAALDDWWSAAPGASGTSGWLGRWLDQSGDDDPLRAVALGTDVPALLGVRTRGAVVLSPRSFTLRAPARAEAAALVAAWSAPVAGASGLEAAFHQAEFDAADAVSRFARVMADDPGSEAATPDGGEAAPGAVESGLAQAARLLAGEPASRVVHLAASGYDTHAAQAASHERLLDDLGTGIARFYAALARTGDAERTLLVTVSEFGRRVAENGSAGTDHGKAGVQLVVGPGVKGGVYGEADLAHLADGDLAPQIDPRSLYAIALHWLGTEPEAVLGGSYDRLGVVA